VPLTGENRVFASLGLEGLRNPVNLGLRALMEVSALDASRPLTATDVAFRLAPRINAAGRMDVARDVIDLFHSKDLDKAREIAGRLNQLNIERQQEEQRIVASMQQRMEAEPELQESFCIVLDGEGWHRGVIGIAASRIVDRWHRPALVVSVDGEEAHGSGRSIPAFHLLNALESCRELFSRFGGHAHAVGFALPSERVPGLRKALDTYARARLTLADFEPVLQLEGELPLSQITPALYEQVCRLQPFGMGNREPVFGAHGVRMTLPPRIVKEKHAKLRVADASVASARSFAAMGWRMAERIQSSGLLAGDLVDIAFTLEQNLHPDFGGLELRLEDFALPVPEAAAATQV
jgi:single-stranded-DNA-specific exonuclease